MSLDVKNINAGITGNSQQGRITVKASRTTYKQRSPKEGDDEYLLSKFDSEGPNLSTRVDDPNYYYPNGI